uniref:Profilin n=1 Tax=Chlamydomonas euryale TaxID=1486919 RepID=A0A6U2DU31_9CHLO|mmetsp:Transcript_21232/g.63603  ORF Transcript_21232/g.63603 Transcript_21232/m.63603 type:complete len:132 (+) Transcript_21232:2187-2582(+)
MEAAAKTILKDAARVVVWDDDDNVLYSDFQANPSELKAITHVFGERDAAIKSGMVLGGTRFEVHRHHPPAVYGRTMGADPETSEGAAVIRVQSGIGGKPCYAMITYQMPNISARMVPLLQAFCDTHVAAQG